jgi:hypothetical protein
MNVESTTRPWAVFRLTRWKAPTPPACHLARSGRNPDVRPLAGGLPKSENCHRPENRRDGLEAPPKIGDWLVGQSPIVFS